MSTTLPHLLTAQINWFTVYCQNNAHKLFVVFFIFKWAVNLSFSIKKGKMQNNKPTKNTIYKFTKLD